MFGAHLSIAGGLHNALLEGRALEMDCVQVFTKNQRQWHAPPLKDEHIRQWEQHRAETGFTDVVSHDSYLINLASPNEDTRRKSLNLLIEEIERCEALSIPALVMHPGAHCGDGEDVGLQRIVEGLDEAHRATAGYKTLTCLENTAGQGSNLGDRFEHLRDLIDRAADTDRLAVCLDTAHALAAGYNLSSESGARRTLKQLDQTVGLERVRVVHVNDSKVERGRRVDRHEHIGHGHVAPEAFRVVCRKFKNVPKILETPKDDAPDGRPWDTVNLETLRGLTARKRAAGG